jgi:hypothetical protein
MGKPMNEQTASRWDAFTPWELQALDEFFRSFGPMRNYNRDIGKLGDEITAAMQRRDIPPFGSPDPLAGKVKAPPGPVP